MAPPTSAVDRTILIGISGSPYSGKTTLANTLAENLSVAYNVDVYILSQSDFICPVEKGPLPDPFLFSGKTTDEKKFRNGGDPKCVKSSFFDIIKDMGAKGKGYDKCKLVKKGFKGVTKVHFDRIVIVEGPLLFWDTTPIKGIFDVQIFLRIDKPDDAWARKLARRDPTPMVWHYWALKPYFDKLAWPQYRRIHRQFLTGTTKGVDIESQGRNASQTAIWAKSLVQKCIAEQQKWWGTA